MRMRITIIVDCHDYTVRLFLLLRDGNFGPSTRNELRTRVRLPDVMLALTSAMDTELERQVAQESRGEIKL